MTRKLELPIVPFDDWPKPDQAAWRAAVRPGDILQPSGPLGARDAEQLSAFRQAYSRWLGYLSSAGAERSGGLEGLHGAHLRAFVELLKASLAPCTVRAYVTSLLTVARAMAPARSFAELHNATRNVWRWAKPVGDKRARVVHARVLYELGLELMAAAERSRPRPRTLDRYRDGLMIALLAARPLRRSNLAAIELDRHIERQGDFFWLAFAGSEMKNGRARSFPLPRDLTEPVQRYLEVYRPRLLQGLGRWRRPCGQEFWISSTGCPLNAKQVCARIVARTRARFGFAVNPHLFRDAAATSIAIEDPEHVGMVAAILGHANPQTAERFYNQAGSLEAGRRLQAIVQSFRT